MRSILELLRTVYNRLTTGESAEEQAVHSGIWMTGINVGDRVLQLLKVVILARLLSPEAFGLLGIALLVIAALRQFSELGFDQALIQHQDDNVDAYLNTAWLMKAARGFVIALVAFLSAPYLAAFFNEPQAGPLIQMIGVSQLIFGLQNPAIMYFQKNLNFHREFVYEMGGRVVDLSVAVIIAFVFRSVWALAIGIVAMRITHFILSYIIHEYRPSIEFDFEYAKEMFGFGKWMFASAILVFMYSQGDDAFTGWFFGATALGFYQISYRFSNAPATEVTHVISRVAFPTFSKVQNDVDRLRNGYFRAVQLSTVIAFPMAAGIVAVASQFVYAVLGNQWGPMIPLIQILAIWGGMRAFGANMGAVFKAVGRPDYDVKLQVLKVVIISIIIYPAAEYFGVTGVAAAIVISSLIGQPIALYLILSIIEAKVIDLLSLVFYPLIGSIIMAAVVMGVDQYIFDEVGLIQLSVLIMVGTMSYAVIMIAIEEWTRYEFRGLFYKLQRSL